VISRFLGWLLYKVSATPEDVIAYGLSNVVKDLHDVEGCYRVLGREREAAAAHSALEVVAGLVVHEHEHLLSQIGR
jgi:hypothetical protein